MASSSKYDSATYPAVRIMNQLRVNAETSGDYGKAKMMKLRFEEFSKAEQQRQEEEEGRWPEDSR